MYDKRKTTKSILTRKTCYAIQVMSNLKVFITKSSLRRLIQFYDKYTNLEGADDVGQALS